MLLSRALPLVLVLTVLPLWPATAQEAGSSRSGSPGARQQPPSSCHQLASSWTGLAKHHHGLVVAGQNGAPPTELCALYQALLSTGSDLVKGMEKHSAACGIPAESLEQMRVWHGKVSHLSNRVCELACFATKLPGLSCVFAAESAL
jgi:hypothetical protein